CCANHFCGLLPTSLRKRRVNVRTLMCARLAMSSSVIGWARLSSTHCRVADVERSVSCGTGCSMNCACPPSPHGATTHPRAASRRSRRWRGTGGCRGSRRRRGWDPRSTQRDDTAPRRGLYVELVRRPRGTDAGPGLGRVEVELGEVQAVLPDAAVRHPPASVVADDLGR